MKKHVMILLLALAMTACGGGKESDGKEVLVPVSDIEVRGDSTLQRVYFQGAPFSGGMVTKSGRTVVECNDGVVGLLYMMRPDGTRALEMAPGDDQPVMYDKEGRMVVEVDENNIEEYIRLLVELIEDVKELAAFAKMLECGSAELRCKVPFSSLSIEAFAESLSGIRLWASLSVGPHALVCLRL